jgi:hypothetical protein
LLLEGSQKRCFLPLNLYDVDKPSICEFESQMRFCSQLTRRIYETGKEARISAYARI